jgi:starch phosphorylase
MSVRQRVRPDGGAPTWPQGGVRRGDAAGLSKDRGAPDGVTIGFFASYKRATLILRDLDRVKRIIRSADMPVQLIFAGKAHPADSAGKELVKQLANFARGADLRNSVAFIENYDMNVASYLVQGVDVWLNTPRRPLEASGTSGMKAAANGILNLSILDGWWDEGFNNEVGWAIGHGEIYDDPEYQDDVEANALYQLLEREVVPLYYKRSGNAFPADWAAKMKTSMMRLLPVFNTNRMVGEYVERFYIPAAARSGDFMRGDLRRVKDLVAWKQFVTQHWSEVRIETVEQGTQDDLHVGSEVSVRVKIQLGSLKPDQVSVELYHGLASVDREVKDGSATALKKARQDNGWCAFA